MTTALGRTNALRKGTAPQPARWACCARIGRIVALVATGVLLLWAVAVGWAVFAGSAARGELGWDLGFYQRIARHWLATGALYFPQQAAPYTNVGEVNLYPPLALVLFVPFLVLPAILWWAVPLGVYAATLRYWRPAWWTWPYLAFVAGTVAFTSGIAHGNSGLWSLALICLALRWPWASALIAFKPNDLVAALPFLRHRSWWVAAVAIGAGALVFGPLWLDYARSVANFRGETLLYGVQGWIVLAAPFVVRLASTHLRPQDRPQDVGQAGEVGHLVRLPLGRRLGVLLSRRPGA